MIFPVSLQRRSGSQPFRPARMVWPNKYLCRNRGCSSQASTLNTRSCLYAFNSRARCSQPGGGAVVRPGPRSRPTRRRWLKLRTSRAPRDTLASRLRVDTGLVQVMEANSATASGRWQPVTQQFSLDKCLAMSKRATNAVISKGPWSSERTDRPVQYRPVRADGTPR